MMDMTRIVRAVSINVRRAEVRVDWDVATGDAGQGDSGRAWRWCRASQDSARSRVGAVDWEA